MMKHIHRQSKRTPQETARLRADRERYQREKPSPEQLLAEGGHEEFVPLGELIALHKCQCERLSRKVEEFCSQHGIVGDVQTAIAFAKECFPGLDKIDVFVEGDPDDGCDQLVVKVTIHTDPKAFFQAYKKCVKKWTSLSPKALGLMCLAYNVV